MNGPEIQRWEQGDFNRRLPDSSAAFLLAHIQTLEGVIRDQGNELSVLRKTEDAMHTLAITDELTGIPNRRGLEERYLELGAGATGATLFVDIDKFKEVNDKHGHGFGDEALRAVAARATNHLRDADTAGRWGGDEFVILLPGMEVLAAVRVGERIRTAVVEDPINHNGTSLNISTSIGIGPFTTDNTLEETVAQADHAMLAAKKGGRNTVVVWGAI